MPELGATLGKRYVFLDPLGAGGFAKVYRARQVSTAQEVAVKVLDFERAGVVGAEHRLERFRRETRLCAELHHPNIVPLIDSGQTEEGLLYVVFSLVPGRTLGTVLREEGALDPAEALHLMTQVLDAVSCAHARGIVHRDLKPENIMISATGARRNALVLDFGIGTVALESQLLDLERVTKTGEYLGTPAYSAPEQLRGAPAMLVSDLYSWGLIFLECLTGSSVFGEGSAHERLHRQFNGEPIPLPAVLEHTNLGRLLTTVTQKDFRKRELDASALLFALQSIDRADLPARAAVEAGAWGSGELDSSERRVSLPALGKGPRWLVPFARNPGFVGRDGLLASIDQLLRASRSMAAVALHGLGGVGKSQLALEFAYRNTLGYRLVAWLRAETPEMLSEDYSAMAPHLGLPETPDQRQKVDAVREWLEQHDRWLLIFDNAPNPMALRRHLPRNHQGHVLVTSRHHGWRDLAASLPVRVLEPDEAVRLLVRRTGDADEEHARELGEDLGHLPLALEEAAAYIDATGRSIASYLALLRDQRARAEAETSVLGVNASLRATWELSFRAVEQEGPLAADVLKLCAFLAPDDVPYGLFRASGRELTPRFAARFADDVALDACIATLRRYSLVHAEADGLSVHRLVQQVTRERLSEADRRQYAALALELVDSAYPDNAITGDVTPQPGRLLPHALSLLPHVAEDPDSVAASARVLRRTGIYMSARGLHVAARDQLERALASFQASGSGDAAEIGATLWELGMVVYALGEPVRARAHLEQGLRVLISAESLAARVLAAQTLIALAWVLRGLGEYSSALLAATQCRERALKSVGPRHGVVAMSAVLMARAEWSLNRLARARELVREAVEILAQVRDALPLIAGTWYTLAQLELDLGEYELAREHASIGRVVGERAFGRDHSLVALNVYIEGLLASRRGDIVAARALLQRAVDSSERTCLFIPEDLALAKVELAELRRREGDYGLARSELARMLEAAHHVYEDRSRFEGMARIALAGTLLDLGDLDAAEEACRQGLATLTTRYGDEHPIRMQGLNQLGWTLAARGQVEAARTAFSEALRLGGVAELLAHDQYVDAARGLRELALE